MRRKAATSPSITPRTAPSGVQTMDSDGTHGACWAFVVAAVMAAAAHARMTAATNRMRGFYTGLLEDAEVRTTQAFHTEASALPL